MLLCEAWPAKTILTRGLQAQWLRLFSRKSTTRNAAAFKHSPTPTHFSDYHRILLYPITHKHITINFGYLLPAMKWGVTRAFFSQEFCKMKSDLYRREKRWAKADREESQTPRFRLQERTSSPLRHERVSYLLLCCRQKGFLLFRNLDTCSLSGQSHKASLLPKVFFFPSGFCCCCLGFFTSESKGQNSGFSRGKGWNSRLNRRTAEHSLRDVVFQGAFTCKSFFILSVNKTGRGGRKLF